MNEADKEAVAPDTEEAATEETSVHPDSAEVEELQAKVKEYYAEMLRARAEADNVRKRAAREAEKARLYAVERFANDLLPVIDSLERGIEAASEDRPELKSIREGSALTLRVLLQAFEKHGLTVVDPAGETFDPERHEAMSMVSDSDQPAQTVVSVIQKGYVLNDRLLRPALVTVATGQ